MSCVARDVMDDPTVWCALWRSMPNEERVAHRAMRLVQDDCRAVLERHLQDGVHP